MSGEEMYESIKELTGAKVYEEKKEESISVLEKASGLKRFWTKKISRTFGRTKIKAGDATY